MHVVVALFQSSLPRTKHIKHVLNVEDKLNGQLARELQLSVVIVALIATIARAMSGD